MCWQKTLRLARRRELVRYLEATYKVSERRGCRVLRSNRAGHRYRAIRNDQAMLRGRIRELAAARVRYGYVRIYILLRREGWKINHQLDESALPHRHPPLLKGSIMPNSSTQRRTKNQGERQG